MSGVTPSRCFSPTGVAVNDIDSDGMDDWCETQFAGKFRPQMVFATYDCDVTRDPYFAVKYFPARQQRVRIFYALSYIRDCGVIVDGCPYALCGGHEGDSEFIVIDVAYEPSVQHWYVVRRYLSAHEGELTESSSENCMDLYGGSSCNVYCLANGICPDHNAATNPEWVDKPGGIARVWVAVDKHGSFATADRCRIGGWTFDSCSGNALPGVRLYVNLNHNLGSVQYNLPNAGGCVQTGAQVGRTGTECFWSQTQKFSGWAPVYGDRMAQEYGKILRNWFECWNYENAVGASECS